MTRFLIPVLAATTLLAATAQAQAACSAEYKAKRDNPLELFYDVAQVSGPCTVENATAQLQTMLARQGLTLLKVLSVSEG
ncbi:hypothetical protein [Roseovarius sp. 2305UL8-3]|uniref:hypothetical protein n=1 Tax=Roseovarius conchicola TaxID=3121636 RepID=UPI003527C80C